MADSERELLLEEIERTLDQIIGSQVPEENILEQWEVFRKGLPFIKLLRPCTIGDGIRVLGDGDSDRLLKLHQEASRDGRTMKFVPASGAATRMFKDLVAAMEEESNVSLEELKKRAETETPAASVVEFISCLDRFAFIEALELVMLRNGVTPASLLGKGAWRQILRWVLQPEGLNYRRLPKGLILFHRYPEGPRTPIHEHLVEAGEYVLNKDRTAVIHFTVSEEHLDAVRKHIEAITAGFGRDIKFDIGISVQKRSTNTIAVTLENEPFRDAQGKLVFRPGGHGALLENLNDLHGDLVFIKNVDNVIPDRLKPATVFHKKLLCGLLIEVQKTIFGYLKQLDHRPADESLLDEIAEFARDYLSIVPPDGFHTMPLKQRSDYFFSRLNRPLRVCGMVRNEGEPGGGPFWTVQEDGEVSIQIVESAQVDANDPEQKKVLSSSTHFNPVDLVCGVRDFEGKRFNLLEFSDKNMGFITIKSKDGRQLKAMELPGLWNGAMAFWNTLFVEVPSITFNPVKSVNDLLRQEHT